MKSYNCFLCVLGIILLGILIGCGGGGGLSTTVFPTPTPIQTETASVITPAGGVLELSPLGVRAEFPEGAFSENTEVIIQDYPYNDKMLSYLVVNKAFKLFSLQKETFKGVVSLKITVPQDFPQVGVYYYEPTNSYIPLEIKLIEASQQQEKILQVEIDKFGIYLVANNSAEMGFQLINSSKGDLDKFNQAIPLFEEALRLDRGQLAAACGWSIAYSKAQLQNYTELNKLFKLLFEEEKEEEFLFLKLPKLKASIDWLTVLSSLDLSRVISESECLASVFREAFNKIKDAKENTNREVEVSFQKDSGLVEREVSLNKAEISLLGATLEVYTAIFLIASSFDMATGVDTSNPQSLLGGYTPFAGEEIELSKRNHLPSYPWGVILATPLSECAELNGREKIVLAKNYLAEGLNKSQEAITEIKQSSIRESSPFNTYEAILKLSQYQQRCKEVASALQGRSLITIPLNPQQSIQVWVDLTPFFNAEKNDYPFSDLTVYLPTLVVNQEGKLELKKPYSKAFPDITFCGIFPYGFPLF